MESNDWELLKTYEPVHKIDWKIYTFVARNCTKVTEPKLDAGEKIETIECGFDEFIAIVESDKYWGNELVLDVLRMKQSEGGLEEFRKRVFGSN